LNVWNEVTAKLFSKLQSILFVECSYIKDVLPHVFPIVGGTTALKLDQVQ
jgi:hypothetical protein